MNYRKYVDTYIVRLGVGDEICASMTALAEKEKIALAELSGIGAVNAFTVGVYDTAEKKYYANEFSGAYEIVSLSGNITQKDGKPYLHLHFSAGNSAGRVFGGHLNSAVISATAEIFVRTLCGAVGRRFDEGIGLNLLDFEK